MSAAQTTTDPDTIRRWAEKRGGHPARVKGRDILRIDFGEPEDSLEEISWEHFFEVFEQNQLAFLYQDQVGEGGTSRFFKLVARGNERQSA